MKTKIFKLLSVVMALAMVFSMFACVAHAEEAETVAPVMVQGTVDGQTGEIIPTVTTRLSSQDLFTIADFESATVASGYKAYFHFYDANGAWKASCGGWKFGNVTIGTLSGITSETVSFRVVVGPEVDGDLAPENFPADGLVLTKKVVVEEPEQPEQPENPADDSLTYTPEMTMGNVKTAVGGGLVFNPSVNTRITSKDLIAIADIEKVDIAPGYKAWYYTYDADGILTLNAKGEVKGSDAWKTGTYTAEDLQKISDKGVYFSVTVATDNNDAFAEAVLPEGICVITKLVRPELVIGNVKTAVGGGLVINSSVNTRATTKELLPIADYKKVKIGAGYKAWYYTYDANGILIPNAKGEIKGSDAWKEGDYTAMALMGLSDKGVYFSVTVATLNNDALDLATLPKEAFALVKAPDPVIPAWTQGTIDKGTIMPNVNTRFHSEDSFKIADFENIVIAKGYKVYLHSYDAEGKWLNGWGWKEAKDADLEISAVDIEKDAKGGTHLKIVVSTLNNDTLTADAIPAEVVKLIVKGAYGACLEHKVAEYKSDENATCLEDGTKSGTCSVCGEKVTVKDEYTAFGHKFDDANDTECNNGCGYIRDLTVPCEHDYRKYTSNNDATCTEDGTKSATCLLCGEVDTIADENTKLGHKAEYTSNDDATCDKNATQTGVCERCKETVTIDIEGSALGHKYASDADDYCSVCGTERTRYTYYVSEGTLGGVDSNDGLTAETPIATIEKAIKLANEKGATMGDIVELKLAGTVTWGGTIDGNWEEITEHTFKLILTSEDGTAYAAGTKNVTLGGPVTYDNVVLDAGSSWKSFLANGKDFTFGKGFASDMFDLALGARKNIDVNKDVTYTFNAFFPKIWVGNTYHTANYNKKFTLNLNGNLRADGTVDTRAFTLVLGAGENGKVVFNGIGTIINNTPNALTFKDGGKVVVGENGAFNIINKTTDVPVDITNIGLTDEALAKTWVLNANNMAALNPTDVAGEFNVQMGYVATATPVEGDAITSAAGKLVLPAGQYAISFAICGYEDHVYDDDTDATCNRCGAIREVILPCEHVWSDYVANGDATCETLGTESRSCELCGETETRDVEGEATGHIYGEDLFCTACGIYQITDPVLVKVDGIWKYYVNGAWDQTATTLHKLNGKWFLVEDGIWSSATRLVDYKGKTFFVVGGKWNSGLEDTLYKIGGKWYYIIDGKLAVDKTTMVKYKGKWFYVEEGKMSLTSRFVEYKGVTFYIKGGKWFNDLNTLIKKDGKYIAVKSGKLFEGKGIITYNGKKFYVNKGEAQLKYSGKVTINGKKYTVKKGKIV